MASVFQRAEDIQKELATRRRKIRFIAESIGSSIASLGNIAGADGTVRDAILDQIQHASDYLSEMNSLFRELYTLDREHGLGIDVDSAMESNEQAAEEFQTICEILPQLQDIYESDTFVDEMDELLADSETKALLPAPLKKIQTLQDMANSFVLWRPNLLSSGFLSKSTMNTSSAPSVPSSTEPKVDHELQVENKAEKPGSSESSIVRPSLLPIAGGIAGGLVLGPAGLLLGFKGVAVISACAAVGMGVGAASASLAQYIASKSKKSPSTDTKSATD